MTKYEYFFPRGIAKGLAFCNRDAERARLKRNLGSCQHTLIMSPRRYGKTSLVEYTIAELALPYGQADLFVAVDAKRIAQQILAAITQVISAISSPLEYKLSSLRDYFRKTNKQWFVGTQGVNIALLPNNDTDPATNILEGLSALEDLLEKKQTRAVLFLDEVQEISEVAEGSGIEGAIRHVAQQTRFLTLVFSGSNRHLLAKMFYDRARPLYKLCDRVILTRISAEHYKQHLNKLAKKRWNAVLEADSLAILFELTELHSFYLNNLCLKLWGSDLETPPHVQDIILAWEMIMAEERLEMLRELSTLTPRQRSVLIAIANGRSNGLTSKVFLREVDLSSSSVIDALHLLEAGDYIERNTADEYVLIDPLLKAVLKKHFSVSS